MTHTPHTFAAKKRHKKERDKNINKKYFMFLFYFEIFSNLIKHLILRQFFCLKVNKLKTNSS